ncbi:hypothetical protein [Vibrio sp. TRT 29B02]|uniref:hypothetical protein n=1 Tax=Vibrio sp. TRT 29B02 TaxID=3418508 RepID=UPI00396B4925
MTKQLKTIIDTVRYAKKDIASYGEIVIDLFIEDELLKNVPIVEHALKIRNICDVYRANKVKRNYLSFIDAVSVMDSSEIEKFETMLFESGDLGVDASETLFDILIDGHKTVRAKIAGNLVAALAKGKLDLDSYYNLLLIAHSGSIPALLSIPKTVESMAVFGEWDKKFGIPEEPLLISLGIAKKLGSILMLSSLGKQFYKYGYNIPTTNL